MIRRIEHLDLTSTKNKLIKGVIKHFYYDICDKYSKDNFTFYYCRYDVILSKFEGKEKYMIAFYSETFDYYICIDESDALYEELKDLNYKDNKEEEFEKIACKLKSEILNIYTEEDILNILDKSYKKGFNDGENNVRQSLRTLIGINDDKNRDPRDIIFG